MTNPIVGKVLKFTMPSDKDKFVLVIIIGEMASYYTRFENIDGMTLAFSERYIGDSDVKIRNKIDSLYSAGYFHWAWHTLDGERMEEELSKRYIEKNTDPEITFDDWVRENCDTLNLQGGN